MSSLYQLQNEILECVSEDGELLDVERFEQINMAIEDKIEGLCLWVKNLEADAAAIKNEEAALKDRRQWKEKRAESIRNYVQEFLSGKKFETSKVSISYRKSAKLEIAEGAVIPEVFLKPQEPKVNVDLLKRAVKAGEVFEGVQLVERQNMSIK